MKLLRIIILIFAAGAAVFLYPAVSELVNRRSSGTAIRTYEQKISAAGSDPIEEMYRSAEDYNCRLYYGTVTAEEYYSLLNADEVMAAVEIPSLNISLPVYHGTDDEVLQNGAGHLEGTSLPIGGESTHSVITAHCGLPSARLFTDLYRLREGDVFKILVLGDTLFYRVYGIEIAEPEADSSLAIRRGKDLATLVTCTPYGKNTHRLLVHGERFYGDTTDIVYASSTPFFSWRNAANLAVIALALIFVKMLRTCFSCCFHRCSSC